MLLWEIDPEVEVSQFEDPSQVQADVNGDGVVDIQDLVLIAGNLGQPAPNRADVNGDGIVNILDLVLVAGMIDELAGGPMIYSDDAHMLRTTDVKQWLEGARIMALADVTSLEGIQNLRNLLTALTPERTALLPNYPNPFNPETWIPYHLASDADVHVTVYDTKGVLVRELDLGHQPAGFYTERGMPHIGMVATKVESWSETVCTSINSVQGNIRRRAGW